MSPPDVDLVIRGGQCVLEDGIATRDLSVRQGRIAAIQPEIRPGGAEVIDAHGLVIFPGLVDGHVHFNEPGRAHWEGWESGTRGAAAGGVTTVLEMPLNASPPTITAAAFDAKHAAARQSALVDYGLWGGLVDDNRGYLEDLFHRGVVAFKAFMCDSGIDDFSRVSDDLISEGMRIASRLGALIGVHAESQELTQELTARIRSQGRTDRRAWAESRPPAAELEAIERLVACANRVGAGTRLHVVHVSTAEGHERIRAAGGAGLRITSETCPHYLTFTDDDFARVGPALKCAPPLRSADSRERLWQAVLEGRVDLIQSDHSPCPAADKAKGDRDVWQAWGGIAGIQATLPVLLTEGVHRRGMTLGQVAHLTATNPARLFRLYPRKGTISVGADADLALVDLDWNWTLTPDLLQTRSGVSGYLGRPFRGAVVRTVLRGKTVFLDSEVIGEPGYAELVRPVSHQASADHH